MKKLCSVMKMEMYMHGCMCMCCAVNMRKLSLCSIR